MLRRSLLAAALLLAACSRDDAADRKRPSAPAAAAPAPGQPAAADAARATQVTKAQRGEYRRRLRAGRKLAGEGRWGEAVTEFEAALKGIPMDGRALSELGWAAFQAGDFAKARRANADAVRVAASPKVRAASLYNLGRVAEATGDKGAAVRHYARSLLLRPNATVAERLSKLGKPPAPAARDASPPPCAAPRPLAEVCQCLVTEDERVGEGAEEGFAVRCEEEALARPLAGAKVLRVDISSSESDYFLAGEAAGGWAVLGQLAYLYRGGVAGVSGDYAVDRFEARTVGGGRVLWVEGVETRQDSDLGIDEIEHIRERRLSLCVLADPAAGPPRCVLEVPLEATYTRERLGVLEPDEIDDEVRKLQTPGLPVRDEVKLDVKLGDDGTATVVLVKGQATDPVKALLGPHKLW